jgi:hypothetical protein
VLVLGVVIVFDVAAALLGGESMTDTARRWFHHGVARWFVLGLIVYLAAHLTVLPWRVDPLDRAYAWLQEKRTRPYVNPHPGEYPHGKG